MSDPRLDADIIGKNAQYLTAYYDNSTITYSATTSGGSSAVGKAVYLSSDGTIALTVDAAGVLGKLIKVESDGYCTVQISGGMTLPEGSSVTTTVGKAIVGALGSASAPGYIRDSDGTTAAEIQVQRGFIWDDDTTTAIQVYL